MLQYPNETQKRVNRDSEEKNTNYNSMQQLSIKRKTFFYVSGDLDRMNVSLKPLHLV